MKAVLIVSIFMVLVFSKIIAIPIEDRAFDTHLEGQESISLNRIERSAEESDPIELAAAPESPVPASTTEKDDTSTDSAKEDEGKDDEKAHAPSNPDEDEEGEKAHAPSNPDEDDDGEKAHAPEDPDDD